LKNIQHVIDNGAVYIFYATKMVYEVSKAINDSNLELMAILAWVKINTGYADMNSHYKNKYEPCAYCKAGKGTNFIGDTSENTVWEIEKDRVNDMHPTQKPIALAMRAIKNHKAKIVADLFGGSGSTLIACEQLDRICYMMEIDLRYCDVILTRWQNFTGKQAVHAETGEHFRK
jgi:DNA modification methylase